MRIVIVGAGGRTGRLIAAQALGHGHDVVALVRDAARSGLGGERLEFVEGDAGSPEVLARALDGADAVISAIGAMPAAEVHVYSDLAADLVRLMTARGQRRLVVVTAAGVNGGPEVPWWLRLASSTVLRSVIDDMARMEDEVFLSELDWTIVRPAGLTDAPATGHYRTVSGSVVPKGTRIARGDVAGFVLKCAETRLFVREAVAIAY